MKARTFKQIMTLVGTQSIRYQKEPGYKDIIQRRLIMEFAQRLFDEGLIEITENIGAAETEIVASIGVIKQ